MTKCIDCSKPIRHTSIRCQSCANRLSSTSHRLSKTRLYIIWSGMKSRCNDISNASYSFYGALGITYCPEWEDFIVFRSWALANGYSSELTLDRIESTRNYTPDNCRWVDKTIQYTNRKIMSNNTSGYKGVGQEKGKIGWYARIALEGKRVRLGRFTTAEEAALAYNNYIIENNLPHKLNTIL